MVVASLLGAVPLVTGDLAEAGSALEPTRTAAVAGAGAAPAGDADRPRVHDDLDGSSTRATGWPQDAEEIGVLGDVDGEGLDGGAMPGEDRAFGQDETYGEPAEDLPADLGYDAGPPGSDGTPEPAAAPAPAPSTDPEGPPEPVGPAGSGDRYPGADRFEAAALRALDEHPGGALTVHLVLDGSPEAATALAGSGDGVPVLLTTARCLPAATAGAIESLGAHDTVLLGPRDAVGADALTTVCPEG